MQQSEFEQHVGAENICANVTEALSRAQALYAEIANKAPSVEHWGRRKSDHPGTEKPVAKAASSQD
jgi:hypothetical protein